METEAATFPLQLSVLLTGSPARYGLSGEAKRRAGVPASSGMLALPSTGAVRGSGLGGRFLFVQNLHQWEGPSRAAQLSGAQRKWSGPQGGYCHLGGQGPLLENISLRALLGETYVTGNYNSSGVPGTGSALPLQTLGPRASGGAEGQHLQRTAAPLPPPGPCDAGTGTHKSRILHHLPPPSLAGAAASSMGEGEWVTWGRSCCQQGTKAGGPP